MPASPRPATSAGRRRPSRHRTWCGGACGPAAVGRARPPAPRDAAEATTVAARAASSSRSGRSGGIVRASSVLPGARRPDQEQRVAAGEGDLERPSRHRLAAHVREVHDRRAPARRCPAGPSVRPVRRGHPARGRATGRAASRPRGPEQPPPPPRRPPRRPARCRAPAAASAAASAGTTTRRTPARPEREAHRQDPRDPAHLAAQPQLPDQRHASRRGAKLLRAEQDPEGDREVQRRPGLAQLGRGEVDGDPPRRVVEARRCAVRRGRAPAPRTARRPAGRRS